MYVPLPFISDTSVCMPMQMQNTFIFKHTAASVLWLCQAVEWIQFSVEALGIFLLATMSRTVVQPSQTPIQ